MKILFSLIFWFLISGQLSGQVRLTVSYETRYETYSDSSKTPVIINKFLVITKDSLSYSISYESEKDSSQLPIPLGSKYSLHSRFANFSSKRKLFQSHPMGMSRFLVEDIFVVADWKLHDETRMLNGYLCKKASAKIDKKEITVFYAPDLPPFIGPFFIGGLPGTILLGWWEDAPYVCYATSVHHTAYEIVEPSIGKKITRKEFDNRISKLHKRK